MEDVSVLDVLCFRLVLVPVFLAVEVEPSLLVELLGADAVTNVSLSKAVVPFPLLPDPPEILGVVCPGQLAF